MLLYLIRMYMFTSGYFTHMSCVILHVRENKEFSIGGPNAIQYEDVMAHIRTTA